jgi:histidine ammonia-lyase
MDDLLIDGNSLSINDVISIAYSRSRKVRLTEGSIKNINKASDAVAEFVRQGKVVYGITTGFGAFKDKIIPTDQVELLQNNILLSHAVGVGPVLDEATTRAMMLIRANTLAKGNSGIKIETLNLLLDMLNKGIYPVIPEKGSLGASGDLAPLAHMSLPLIGIGEVIYQNVKMPSMEAFSRVGLEPIKLTAKEGLALTNGTSFMTALGAISYWKALFLIKVADLSAAFTLEAVNGTSRAFDARIHELRPHEGQRISALNLRNVLEESSFVRGDDPRNVQDAYTLRCIPQVHGAVRDTLSHCLKIIETEINSVTDNPLIFFDDLGNPEIISGGNFHGEPLAFAMDFLGIAITDLGNMMERRIAKLVDETNNQHELPAFLTKNGGVNSGFMLLQYTAAALASENKVLSHPSSTDSIPSSANVEDHVSMGANSALHARDVLTNTEMILSLELFSAGQAVDFRKSENSSLVLGKGTRQIYKLIRKRIPFLEKDTLMYPLINSIHELMTSEEFVTLVNHLVV